MSDAAMVVKLARPLSRPRALVAADAMLHRPVFEDTEKDRFSLALVADSERLKRAHDRGPVVHA